MCNLKCLLVLIFFSPLVKGQDLQFNLKKVSDIASLKEIRCTAANRFDNIEILDTIERNLLAFGHEETVLRTDNGNHLDNSIVKSYRNNLLVEEIKFENGKLLWKKTYLNSKNQQLLKKYDKNGKLLTHQLSDLDAQGKLINTVEYNGSGRVLSKKSVEYHGKNSSTEKNFNKEGTLISTIANTYDNRDNLIVTEVMYTNDKSKTIYTYNGKGQATKEAFYSNKNRLIQFKTIDYDSMGNISVKKYWDGNKKLIETYTVKYMYDNNGNWTLADYYKNGVIQFRNVRSIKYRKKKVDCLVEVKCKYGIANVCRFNILVGGEKYSKVFNCDEDSEIVKRDAEDACKAGLLDISWEDNWRDDCPTK